MTTGSRAVLLLAVAFAVTASADIMPVQLMTTGVFTGEHPGFTFQGVDIPLQNTSSNGSLDLTLGTFTLDSFDNDFSGIFTLTLMFSHPDLIVTGNTQSFSATYTGMARQNNDTAELVFNSSGAVFNFNGLDGVGSFALSIDPPDKLSHKDTGADVRSVTVQGHITNATVTGAEVAPVPEPSSVALFCIPAVAGIVLLRSKRNLRPDC